MSVNKVIYDGNTLVDLTGDTVAAGTMFSGVTAHGKDGKLVTGTFTIDSELAAQDSLISQIQTALQGKISGA